MDFLIDSIDKFDVADEQVYELLQQVYVQGGFTDSENAKSIFEPQKVKSRGSLFVALDVPSNQLAGMVIVVPSTSSSSKLAKDGECEMHLFGVAPQYRSHGLGRSLVEKALEFAADSGFSKMLLWTQTTMTQAQHLYEAVGFKQYDQMSKNGIEFLMYEKCFT